MSYKMIMTDEWFSNAISNALMHIEYALEHPAETPFFDRYDRAELSRIRVSLEEAKACVWNNHFMKGTGIQVPACDVLMVNRAMMEVDHMTAHRWFWAKLEAAAEKTTAGI